MPCGGTIGTTGPSNGIGSPVPGMKEEHAMDHLITWGRRLVLALQFLTRVPIKRNLAIFDGDLPASTVFFPLVGFAVGAFGALCAVIAAALTQSVWAASAAAVLGGVLITGALHVDGLGDTCDGVFSGRTRDRALEIMRDSRMGSFGVLGITFSILLKVILLGVALERGGMVALSFMMLVPMAGRLGIVTAAAAGRPARSDGSGRLFLNSVYAWHFLAALAFSLIVLVLFLGAAGLLIALVAVLAAGLTAWMLSRRLGGLTGDCLGAVNECAELAALTAAVALIVYRVL